MSEITYTLICRDGFIRNFKDPHSNDAMSRRLWRSPKRVTDAQGHHYVELGYGKGKPGRYLIEGRVYRYEYSLFRNVWPFPLSLLIGAFISPYAVPIGAIAALWFYRMKYVGNRMIWIEGNPAPVDFRDKKWRDALDDTAYILKQQNDLDSLERLARPRRLDYTLIMAAGFIGLLAGAVIVLAYKGG